tara:strand:+ start:758 stop:967 length:210 start_codon:yes stop_codon:yes gene_type:complete
MSLRKQKKFETKKKRWILRENNCQNLLEGEGQEKSKTFTDCFFNIFKITQEEINKEFQVERFKSVILFQ